jgi:hypothetical protein
MVLCLLSKSFQRRSPSSVAFSVERIMSVNNTVASTRSGTTVFFEPVRNSSRASIISIALSPIKGM